MRRSTEDCLKDLQRRVPASDIKRSSFYRPIAEYCDATNASIGEWISLKRIPTGEKLLRLRYYLAGHGYTVSELEALHPVVKTLGRLVAEKKIDLDETWRELGCTSRDGVFAALIHGHIPVPERLSKMVGIISRHQGAYAVPAMPQAVPVEKKPGDAKEPVLAALALMIQAAMPLADFVLSGRFSAEDRQMLRDLTGKDGVYRLANMMNRLCSETARDRIAVYTGR